MNAATNNYLGLNPVVLIYTTFSKNHHLYILKITNLTEFKCEFINNILRERHKPMVWFIKIVYFYFIENVQQFPSNKREQEEDEQETQIIRTWHRGQETIDPTIGCEFLDGMNNPSEFAAQSKFVWLSIGRNKQTNTYGTGFLCVPLFFFSPFVLTSSP